jgi:hypothetical protein
LLVELHQAGVDGGDLLGDEAVLQRARVPVVKPGMRQPPLVPPWPVKYVPAVLPTMLKVWVTP